MNYLWLDLETTGLDPYLDSILEVAAVITDERLVGRAYGTWLVPPAFDWVDHASSVVLDMHEKSGLLAELEDSDVGFRLPEVETNVIELIAPHLCDGRIVLAGSGVATFDLSVIKAQMPDLAHFLAYYTLDIGVVRRFLHLAGVITPDLGPVQHRALDDVEHHLSEARHYLSAFRTLGWDLGNEMHR